MFFSDFLSCNEQFTVRGVNVSYSGVSGNRSESPPPPVLETPDCLQVSALKPPFPWPSEDEVKTGGRYKYNLP